MFPPLTQELVGEQQTLIPRLHPPVEVITPWNRLPLFACPVMVAPV